MNQNKFQPDKKLFTICIYALITTVVARVFDTSFLEIL